MTADLPSLLRVSPQPVIRGMAATDLEAVLALEQATPQAPHWTLADYQQCLPQTIASEAATLRQEPQPAATVTRAGLVAEVEGVLKGFAVVRQLQLPAAQSTTELESIVVEASARSQGLGTLLMNAVLDLATQSGAHRLELEVRASNHAAIRLYSSAGMLVEGRRPRYYSAPEEDAILMGKAL